MVSFVVAACQLAAGADPRDAVLGAARAGARLVVLPAFALQTGPAAGGPAPGGSGAQPSRRESLWERAKALAREAGCYLVPGSALVESAPGRLEHVAWLISPAGELIGEQAQTNTTREEEAAGWVAASELRVFEIDLGGAGAPPEPVKVGLLAGLDPWIPEVSRILALRGAELLIAPLALPAPYSEARQVAGMWQEVQQNQTVAIEACLVGQWRGQAYAGRSAVTGPCEMVPDESGFVARAAADDEPLTLTATIDLDARRNVVRNYDLFAELNVDLYRKAFPDLYLAGRPGVSLAAACPKPETGGGPAAGSVGCDPEPGPPAPLPLPFKEKAFRSYLTLTARPASVRQAVRSLGIRPGRGAQAGPAGRRVVRAAAIQLESFYAKSPREYALRLGERFREAVQAGAGLVAFPELTTIPLMGLLPGVEDMAKAKAAPAAPAPVAPAAPAPAAPAAPLPRLADIVRFMEPVLRGVYFALFSALAEAGRVWVMAGSTPLPAPDGKVYNVAALFGPDGRLAGTQRKLHLFPREKTEGLVPGSRLEVFDIGPARVALPICMDATYFETYRLAAFLGAEIVAAPVSNVEPYDYWKMLRGAWPRAQETPVYAVQSTIVGDFLGDPMTGKASIFAPMELTADGSGILAQCPEPVGPGLAVADLDLDALAAFREERSSFARVNPELVRKYLPGVYDKELRTL